MFDLDWFRRFDRKNGWPSYAKNQQEAALPYCGSIGLLEAKHSYNTWTHPTFMKETVQPTLSTKVRCVNSDVFGSFGQDHVLTCAYYRYYVCVWMVFVCLISMTCCLWSMIGQGGAKASAGTTPSTQLGSFRIAASCWHVIWELCSAGGQSCMGRDWINGRLSSLNSLKI